MIEFLYQAMTSPYGLKLRCSDVSLAQARCYQARAKAQDPELDRLQFRPGPLNQDELWIILGPKKEVPDGPPLEPT